MRTGELAVLRFRVDGRSITGLSVKLVLQQNGGQVLSGPAACTAGIGRGRIFIGCENNDSVILGWSSGSTKTKRQRSIANMDTEDGLDASDLDEGDLEDEDDLYSNEKPSGQTITQLVSPTEDEAGEYTFRIHDHLQNIAPLGNVAFVEARDTSEGGNGVPSQVALKHELVVASGYGKACTLNKMSPTIIPQVHKRHLLGNIQGVWSVTSKRPSEDRHQDSLGGNGRAENHEIIITSMVDNFGEEQSRAYSVKAGEMEELAAGDFDSYAGATMAVGTLNNGTRIVQVLKAEIRAYEDGEFWYEFPTRFIMIQEYIIERFSREIGSHSHFDRTVKLHMLSWYCELVIKQISSAHSGLRKSDLLGNLLLLMEPNLCHIV